METDNVSEFFTSYTVFYSYKISKIFCFIVYPSSENTYFSVYLEGVHLYLMDDGYNCLKVFVWYF